MAKKIILQAKFTADAIGDLLQDFRENLLEKKEDLLIDLSQVEKIDTAGVQLLLVLLKDAIAMDKDISFENTVSREVLQKFTMGGFISPGVKDGKKFKADLLSLMS